MWSVLLCLFVVCGAIVLFIFFVICLLIYFMICANFSGIIAARTVCSVYGMIDDWSLTRLL